MIPAIGVLKTRQEFDILVAHQYAIALSVGV
jgi:hypothetical protein